MADERAELIAKIQSYGIMKDPQWQERLDEPVPLRVLLEMLVQLMERLEPPHLPYD